MKVTLRETRTTDVLIELTMREAVAIKERIGGMGVEPALDPLFYALINSRVGQ